MTTYIVKVGFWLRGYDSVEIEAASDIDAVETARSVAVDVMNANGRPEEIDLASRRAGVIAYVDRVSPDGRSQIVEDFAFYHATRASPV